MDKRLVMLAGPGESTNILFHALSHEFRIARVIIEKPVPRLEFLKRRVKRLGFLKVSGQVLFQALIAPFLFRSAARRIEAIKQDSQLDDSEIDPEFVSGVDSVNSDRAIELLRKLDPDLVVINGTRIISERVLHSVDAPFVNIHAGITPLYRGVHGGYWALVEGRPDACGATVHLVDRGIDTGGIIDQALIEPRDDDNFATYPVLQLAAGINILKRVIPDILAGKFPTKQAPAGKSGLWSHPTILEYLRHRLLRGVR